MACGTPVIASAVGAIPEQFSDGVEGFLAPPGAAEVIAARAAELLRDPARRLACAAAAARRARRYSVEAQVDRFLAWYAEILS